MDVYKSYAGPEEEYWYNVSTQEELPIAGEIELSMDRNSLSAFFSELAAVDELAAKEFVATRLMGNSELFDNIRQFLGVSNKRAYLELSYLASRTQHPTRETGLCGCYPWTLARSPYGVFHSDTRWQSRPGGCVSDGKYDLRLSLYQRSL